MVTSLLHRIRYIAVAALLGATVTACTTVAETGRTQFNFMSDRQANQMGLGAYQQIKKEKKISRNTELAKQVRQVGNRVAKASGRNYAWEFTLFEDENPNAFALPGGKVGVNTGLFKVAKNRDQLAAVMAHEVAHATSRHSAERVSGQTGVQAILVGAGAAMGASQNTMNLFAQAATLGVILPFNRSQESEADYIGLLFMARAGYDPRQAVELWKNFANYGGNRPPEFLSTHPSPGNRIQKLQANMPAAMREYQNSPYRK